MQDYIFIPFIVALVCAGIRTSMWFLPYNISCSVQSSQLVNTYYSPTGFSYLNKFLMSNNKTCELYSVNEPFYDKEYLCLYFPLMNSCHYTDLRELELSILVNSLLVVCSILVLFLIPYLVESCCRRKDKEVEFSFPKSSEPKPEANVSD